MNIQSNIADLNAVLPEYMRLSRLSAKDVLSKQGGKLAFNIKVVLLRLVRPKGEIRQMILERLRSGRMIHIRDKALEDVVLSRGRSIFTKTGKRSKSFKATQNIWRAVVTREISIRESGRGVIGQSAKYPISVDKDINVISRGGLEMSAGDLKLGNTSQSVSFTWPGINAVSKRIVKGLQSVRPKDAVNVAIKKTKDDILIYVRRKQLELIQKTLRKAIKA